MKQAKFFRFFGMIVFAIALVSGTTLAQQTSKIELNAPGEQAPELIWNGLGVVAEGFDVEECSLALVHSGAAVNSVMKTIRIVSFSVPLEKLAVLDDIDCLEAFEKESVSVGGGVAGVSN